MVDIANNKTATLNKYGNHQIALAKALDVNATPSIPSTDLYSPLITITNAVMVQITTVSIKGSRRAT